MRDPGGPGRYGAVGLCFIFCAACAGLLVRSAQPALEVTNGGFEEIQDGPPRESGEVLELDDMDMRL